MQVFILSYFLVKADFIIKSVSAEIGLLSESRQNDWLCISSLSSSLLGIKGDLSVMQSQRRASVGSSYNSDGLPLNVRTACMVA